MLDVKPKVSLSEFLIFSGMALGALFLILFLRPEKGTHEIHVFLSAIFLWLLYLALQNFLRWRFKGTAVRINDDGLYIEGVTRHPIKWRDICLVFGPDDRVKSPTSFASILWSTLAKGSFVGRPGNRIGNLWWPR